MNRRLYPIDPILIVDDELQSLFSFEMTLKMAGINNIQTCSDGREVMGILEKQRVELVLMDIMMPGCNGEDILVEIKQAYPDVQVIMITALQDIELAVNCIKKQAFDYITKPVQQDRLLIPVRKALEFRQRERELHSLRQSSIVVPEDVPEAFSSLVTHDEKMFKIFSYCQAVAPSNSPVLVTGETGTGKELISRAIHDLAGNGGPFVACNVAGLDDHLFADTLFGHVKGAYTGAEKERAGLVVNAIGGTLFLDEIGDLSMQSQVKLLRLLQEQEYSPLGSDEVFKADIRVIVATHKDLDKAMEEGTFRRDLYYRLMTHHVELVPLRERVDDIKVLLDHFIALAAKEFNKKAPTYHPSLVTLLKSYHFPGNIRELQGMIYDAVAKHQSMMLSNKAFEERIGMCQLGVASDSDDETLMTPEESIKIWPKLPSLKEMDALLLDEAMRRGDGNQSVASKMLGISKQALSQRLKKK